MAIISAPTILRSVSLLHLTIAYYLLTAPAKIADQNLVFILGAAMDLPVAPPSLSTPTPALALLSLLLTLIAISDLTATGLPEEIGSHYWSSQAPIRLAFFFGVTGYTYLCKPGGAFGGKGEGGSVNVCNSVVFTWGFVEMLCWFWIYVTLRDERREMMGRVAERRKVEDNRL